MRQLERLELVDRIGREVQSRMGFRDIDGFLSSFGVDVTKETSKVNSKWVHTKELLAGEPDDRILRIASELDIPHNHVLLPHAPPEDATFWVPGYFKLFLSHLSIHKVQVGSLQRELRRYGISAFVAHADIVPTREWEREIEKALFSMDALAAILMPGFRESDWTEQEVGVAIGRGCVVVPVMRGLLPYGLIGKIQGVQAGGKTVAQVARGIFDALLSSEQTRSKLLFSLIDSACRSADLNDVRSKLEIIESLTISEALANSLRSTASQSRLILETPALRESVNRILAVHNLAPVAEDGGTVPLDGDDDLPF